MSGKILIAGSGKSAFLSSTLLKKIAEAGMDTNDIVIIDTNVPFEMQREAVEEKIRHMKGIEEIAKPEPFVITNPYPKDHYTKPEPIEQYRRESPKISRNSKCGCGSDKKYKNCCGR